MSDTVLGWLFGGWSFGRSPDNGSAGSHRARQLSDREASKPRKAHQETNARVACVETDDDHLDGRLVAQVRAGDAAALETVFLRHYGPLVRFATSYVGSIDGGKEVVADVFAWLWDHRATWAPPASVAAYLFSAVRNRALDVKKHRAREHRRMTMLRDAGETPGVAAPPLGPAEQVERDDDAAVVLRLIPKLPERRRLILSLRWTHGLTWEEIAAVLGATTAAVKMEHRRILDHLRAELRDV